jgi:hypothetical protein
VKQYDFTYPAHKQLEGVKESLLDQMCEKLNSNVKEIVGKTTVEDFYENFVVELENNIELDCEISLEPNDEEWVATVWEM